MVPEGWFGRDSLGSSEFFFRRPFRHYYFVANTIGLLIVVGMFLLIFLKGWSYLPFAAFGWLVLALADIILLWRLALRTHFNLNIMFTTGQADKPRKGTPLSLALFAAAYMTNLGLMQTLFAVGACLLAIMQLVPKH